MAAITLSVMFGKSGIHYQYAFLTNLQRDIAAGSAQHVHIPLYVLRVDFAIVDGGCTAFTSAGAGHPLMRSVRQGQDYQPFSWSAGTPDTWFRRRPE